jgi:hypothetical protein
LGANPGLSAWRRSRGWDEPIREEPRDLEARTNIDVKCGGVDMAYQGLPKTSKAQDIGADGIKCLNVNMPNIWRPPYGLEASVEVNVSPLLKGKCHHYVSPLPAWPWGRTCTISPSMRRTAVNFGNSAPAAIAFWERAAADPRISAEFRAICAANAQRVQAMR